MPLIPFPNVPKLPGVPPLNRAGYQQASNAALKIVAAAAGLKALGLVARPRTWLVLGPDGQEILLPDSVLSLEYRGDAKISTYPVEGGGFASYNKVRAPFGLHIVMTCTGTGRQSRAAMLSGLDKLKDGPDLVSIVTPDAVYQSLNLVQYDFQRTSKSSLTMLTISAGFEEVAQTAQATVTTAQPAGAPAVNTGTVRADAPTAAQSTAAAGVQ